MSQNEMYNPSQPMYSEGAMGYELNGNMMRAYTTRGASEGSGVITAPKMSMDPRG